MQPFSFLSWIHLLRTPDSREDELRRLLATSGMAAGSIVQGYFAFFNLQYPLTLEDGLDIFSFLLIVISFVLLRFTRFHLVAYRSAVATLIFICTFTLAMPHHEAGSCILNFFVVPVIVFYLLGIREGMRWSALLFIPVILLVLFPSMFGKPPLSESVVTTAVSGLLCAVMFSYVNEHFRISTGTILLKAQDELKEAASQLKRLEGLVPICSYCKKVRDDKGYWRQLETFLAQNTSAVISSGVCQECARDNTHLIETSGVAVPNELSDIFAWRQRYRDSKKKYVRLCTLAGAIIIAAFSIADFVQQSDTSAVVQLYFSLVFIGVWAALALGANAHRVYGWMMFPFYLLMIHPFFYGRPDSIQLAWLFLFPQIAAALVGPFRGAIWTGLLFAFTILLLWSPFPLFALNGSYSAETSMYFMSSFAFLSFFSLLLERIRSGYTDRLLVQLESLESTYKNIKTLKGLIPVCSVCKSIRNDKGFWTQLDSYLLNHTNILLTHGICVNCLEKEMPELYSEMKENDEL